MFGQGSRALWSVGAEQHGQVLERFQPEAEVFEVTRELGGGGVGDGCSVRGVSSEQQHPGQRLGRRGPCDGFIEHSIRLCQVFRGGWPWVSASARPSSKSTARRCAGLVAPGVPG